MLTKKMSAETKTIIAPLGKRGNTALRPEPIIQLTAPMPAATPETIYVGLNDRDKAWHDLYAIDIASAGSSGTGAGGDTRTVSAGGGV